MACFCGEGCVMCLLSRVSALGPRAQLGWLERASHTRWGWGEDLSGGVQLPAQALDAGSKLEKV